MQALINTLRRINSGVAILIGVGFLACAAFIMVEVVFRKMGSSLAGTDEISGYVMAVGTSWGMACALLELAHVRIDLMRTRLAQRGRALMDILSMIVVSGVAILIALRAWPVLERSLANGSRANTPLETPLWLAQGPWLAGWIWFAAMSCILTLAALVMLTRGEDAAIDAAIGLRSETDEFS